MKDEADRYLFDCLNHQLQICDRIVVFDDQSTDESVQIATKLGCDVFIRRPNQASFMEHEGRFRQAAWNCLNGIADDSWVFAFDADEFFVGKSMTPKRAMDRLIEEAVSLNFEGITVPVAEVFGLQADGNPMIRTDGFWRDISGLRIVKYSPGLILDKAMASGSTPPVSSKFSKKDTATILHYGYANPEDKYIKYERYSTKTENGHNTAHIQSILSEPSLTPWKGQFPILSGRL